MVTQSEMEYLYSNMVEEFKKNQKNVRIKTPPCKHCGTKPGDILIKPKS